MGFPLVATARVTLKREGDGEFHDQGPWGPSGETPVG